MIDFNLINDNLRKIQDAGLPYSEAERYLSSEGVSPEQVRVFNSGGANRTNLEPQKPQALPLSDKIAGFGAKAAQGATFGLADILAGLANVSMEKSGIPFVPSIANAARMLAGVPIEEKSFKQLYKEGRQQFNERAQAVEKLYPRTSFLTELAGGVTVPFGAIGKGVKGLAATGAAAGAAYGAGRNVGALIEGEKSVPQALRETAVSSALGGIGGGVLGAAGAGLKSVIPATGRGIKRLAEKLGSERLAKSAREGEPLLMQGERKITDLAQTAKLKSPGARDTILAAVEKENIKQPEAIKQKVKDVFSEKSPLNSVEDVIAEREAKAQPLFAQAEKVGDLAKTHKASPFLSGVQEVSETKMSSLSKDPFYAKYIKEARSGAAEPELRGLPDTDFRVLKVAKEKLDAEISRRNNPMQASYDRAEVRRLTSKKNEFLDAMDEAVAKAEGVPKEQSSYYLGRKVSGEGYKVADAADFGKKFLSMETREAINNFKKLETPAEMDALMVEIKNDIFNRINSIKGKDINIAKSVFGEPTEYKVRQKFIPVLGQEGYRDLMGFVNKQIKKMNELGQIKGGSQTAEKTGLAMGGIPTSSQGVTATAILNRLAGTAFRKTAGVAEEKAQQEIARALTDPAYLSAMLARQDKPIFGNTLAEALLQALKKNKGLTIGQIAGKSTE